MLCLREASQGDEAANVTSDSGQLVGHVAVRLAFGSRINHEIAHRLAGAASNQPEHSGGRPRSAALDEVDERPRDIFTRDLGKAKSGFQSRLPDAERVYLQS